MNKTDFEKFKEFLDEIGIGYEVNADVIYLDNFASAGGIPIVIKFYDNGDFQEFSTYSNN